MLGHAFEIILVILAIIIIIVVLLQGGKAQGLGGTLTGTSDSNLFQNSKESFGERRSKQITYFLIALFIIIAFIFVILIKTGHASI